MAERDQTVNASELLNLEHIEDERTASESNTHWKLRRAFLIRFRDEFSRDRLRSMSMIFCNVTFLNCSYSPAMMKRVGGFSAALHDEIKIAKSFKLARKTFSLPSLNSDEDDTPVFGVDSVLCSINDDNAFSPPTSSPTAAPIGLVDDLKALDIASPSPTANAAAEPQTSPTLGPGVFHISVIEGAGVAGRKPAGKKKKNKKRADADGGNKPVNGDVKRKCENESTTAATGDGVRPSPKKRNKNKATKSVSIETTTTENLFRNLINSKIDHQKKQKNQKKKNAKAKKNEKPQAANKSNVIVEVSD